MVYTIDCGDRVLTIGYLPGDNKFDYEDMRSSVSRMLESMLKDLNDEKRTNYSINQIDNLQLKEIRLRSGANADSFSAEKYSKTIEKVCNIQPEELINGLASSSKTTTNNSITGCYHYRQQINNQTSILKWFNRATNTSSNCTVTPTAPFFDNSNEVDFCVGVRNANQLTANKDYYWWIESTAGDRPSNRPQNGQFKVMAQRSYSVLNPAPSSLSQWFVFGEEHEAILRLKKFETGNTAWSLGSSGYAWKFNAATDSVS